jgi:hypothetical protein
VEGMLMAFLPKEKIVIEADLLDGPPAKSETATAENKSLYTHIQRLGLDVTTIVPIHGQAVSWNEFVKLVSSR